MYTQQTGQSVKSPAIIVNTSGAIAMKPEPPSSSASDGIENISNNMIPMISSGISTGMSEKWENFVPTEHSNNIISNANNYPHKTQTKTLQPLQKQNFAHHHHSNITLEKKAIVSGAYAAVIMFLFILTMFCAFRGISSKLRGAGANDKADYLHQISVNIEER